MSVAASIEVRARAEGLCESARVHLGNGDPTLASACCREALVLDANCFPAHLLLAGIELTGEHYLRLLERIHRHLSPRSYLEIGVADGSSLALAGKNTLCIGVDPAPKIDRRLRPSIRVLQETSDEFFAVHDVKAEFSGRPVDLAFIDGMHHFEFGLRDFINIERHSGPATTVLIHDCYPLDAVTAARDRTTRFWSGDVWKLIVCLKKYRPDLSIHVLASPPTGLGVVRRLDRKSTVLGGQLEALYREFVPFGYSALERDKRGALNVVPGDWNAARRLLD